MADNKLDITMEHMGQDTMVDPVGASYHFRMKFVYNYETLDIETDGNMEGAVNRELALPGPFASWSIEVSEKYNLSLDLSGVTDAWFEFSGWSRTFK